MRNTNALLKAELHCHIEGAAEPDLVLKQAARYGVDASKVVDPVKGYLWEDFSSFLKAYDFVASLFRSPEDYVRLTRSHYQTLAAQNVIYGEVFASPDHAARIGCSYSTLIEAIAEGINQAKGETGIEGRIIVTGVRHVGVEAVEEAARLAVKYPHPLMTGFGMAGDERMGVPADFAKAFDIARDGGLALTVHAGEFGGADSVRRAVDDLKVSRIGHGVRAAEDPELVKQLADEGIVLEVCPVSNIALDVYPDYSSHSFRMLEAAGCKVTLNSDDPPHFHTSMNKEFAVAQAEFGYTDKELMSFTRTAIESAFVDEETRKSLLEKLDSTALV